MGKSSIVTPAQPDQQPIVAYTELPDFDTVEQRIYAGCRRFISEDMLEPIHNLIREAIDADRASRGQAPAPAAVTEPSWEALHHAWMKIGADVAGLDWGAFTHAVHYAPTAQAAPAAQGDALTELLAAAGDMVDTIELMDEDALLALDDDPHPPSSLLACAERLRNAIAARAAKEGNANAGS